MSVLGSTLVLIACVLLGGPAWGAASPDDVEDPRRLRQLAEQALEEGDHASARALFEAMLDRMEIRQFLPYRPMLLEALVLEAVGSTDEAAAKYRQGMADDPLRTVLVLRILSEHPDRDALVAEVYERIRQLASDAAAGVRAQPVYVTSKGAPRFLEPMTTQEVVANARAGKLTRYCYVEDLDFTTVSGPLPEQIVMDRCVLGRIWGPALSFGKLVIGKSFVLGDAHLGKTFEGKAHASPNVQPSSFEDFSFRETVFMGHAGFAAVETGPGRAYFPMVVFEGSADFKGAEFRGVTEFRFASFGKGANFRLVRMYQPVYFGGSRYRADTSFSSVFSERDVYFNEVTFEGAVTFDDCELSRGATFENARFQGPASFGTSKVGATLNLSRAVFHAPVNVREVEADSLDVLGTHFRDDAWFTDATVHGRARFSLDAVTRATVGESGDIDHLLSLYRDYQGDEDADEPLTTQSSYGVVDISDLDARIDGNISFANTSFGGYTVFEGVTFGRAEEPSVASFYNAQFLGETHFERTEWNAKADFTTIFGREVAFNEAHFHHSLVLDDANINGRVSLTDATFGAQADLSFYAAEIDSFEIDPDQVRGEDAPHRLFYERCARGLIDGSDSRIQRISGPDVDEGQVRAICYDNVIDEFVALKESYGERAMTQAEDDAYWWARHHAAMMALQHGSPWERAFAVVQLVLFELCFGWGVRLGNLGLASAAITVAFAWLYRRFCPDTVLVFDGENRQIRDVSFVGLCFVSLQSLIAINTGWDFGDDDHRFRYLNTIETLIGFIILTFFVGAYTRMILA
ncbi:MAG: pentapeptide repeat-containing protein [Myxococcales bacterium]|nr:pentapeptide repeat-containing protein [Myxococcales bacterium]